MKKQQLLIGALYTISIVLGASIFAADSKAALKAVKQAAVKEQAIEPDAISPEEAEEVEEVVVVKKAKARPKKIVKRTLVEETETTPAEEAQPVAVAVATNNNTNSAQAAAVVAPPATKPSMGSQLDQGVTNKMEEVKTQFEAALLKTLDRIKIVVDDGVPAQGAKAPTETAVVEDSLVGSSGAPDKKDYMSVDAAPKVAADDDEEFEEAASAGTSVSKFEKKSERKVRVAPVFGKTMINSSKYNVDSKYTAGFQLEMDVDNNFALVLGYTYSQYDISLGGGNQFYTQYYQPNSFNTTSLQYNQNVFDAGMRMYLMPKEAKFRIYGGAGVGYNVGYLNYKQNQLNGNSYQYNPYSNNTPDYEVKSWLGLVETGAAFNVSENVSLGALFKYAFIFSSSENAPLNNYGFVYNNAYNGGDKAVVGGSLASDSFYSILGTVKVAF